MVNLAEAFALHDYGTVWAAPLRPEQAKNRREIVYMVSRVTSCSRRQGGGYYPGAFEAAWHRIARKFAVAASNPAIWASLSDDCLASHRGFEPLLPP